MGGLAHCKAKRQDLEAVPCCAVLCCQVALEGAINSKLAQSSLARGELPQGDLIPWTMGQQFQVGCWFDLMALFGLGQTGPIKPCCICSYSR